MKNNMLNSLGCFTMILLSIVAVILTPVIIFAAGWFGGWILTTMVGGAITTGMNLLFNTSRFTSDLIPIACGALAVIGSYFKSYQTNTNNKK